MFRVNGSPAIGLAIAMRDGGDILALGRNITEAINETLADLPLGIDATLVSISRSLSIRQSASS